MAKPNFGLIIIVAAAAIVFFMAMSMLVFPIQPSLKLGSGGAGGTPTVTITLYAGELSGAKYGFGNTTTLTSPGPTLRFKTSDVVKVTLVNTGKLPHAFAVVNAPRTGATVLFNSEIASGSNPVPPGQSASVVFKPNSPSQQYYYICPVPGHAELGMYGSVIVAAG